MSKEAFKFSKKIDDEWMSLGNDKSTESIKKNMKGRWTIKWYNESDKYDYLKERHMNYDAHYKYLKENKEIVTLKPTDILSVKNGQVFVNNKPFEVTDPDESLDWPKSVENNELITWFRGNSSMVNRWKVVEISGHYTNLKEGDVNALNNPVKIQYTDNDNYVNSTDGNKSVPNVIAPLNTDTIVNSIPNI